MLRNRLFFLLLLTFLLNGIVKSAPPSRDSLLQVWETPTLPDTSRMKAMSSFINNYFVSIKPDSSRHYGLILLEEAKKNKNQFYKGKALHILGNAAINLGQAEEARNYHTEAFDILQKEGTKKDIASSYNSLGLANQYIGNYELAVQQFEKSIEIKKELGDSINITPNLLNIASIFEIQGNILKSLAYNQNGLRIAKLSNSEVYEAIANNNLANNFKFLGDYSQSVHHYLEAIAIYERTENYLGTVHILNNLALLLIANKDFSKAKEYLDKALKLSYDSNFIQGQAMSNSNLGTLYQDQELYAEALPAFQESLKIIEAEGILIMKPYVQLEIGSTYLYLDRLKKAEDYLTQGLANSELNGRTEDVINGYLYMGKLMARKNQWLKAEAFAKKGYQKSLSFQKHDLIGESAKDLITIYKKLGKSNEVIQMYEVSSSIRDSVFSEENTRALINQEYQYTYQKKAYQDSLKNDAKLQIQAVDIERRKLANWFFVGIIIIIVFFGYVLVNRYRLIQKQKKQIANEKNKAESANAKLREIDQSKSHFFTNISHEFRTPLTVISGMLEQIKEPIRAKELIQRNTDQLLNLINQILDLRKLESGNLSLNNTQGDIIKFLKYGTESFHSLAESKSVELTFHSEQEEQMMDFDQAKLLKIQTNLISNAIKFTAKGGKVQVKVSKENESELKILVQDTGRGISQEKLPLIFDRFYQIEGGDTRTGEGTGIGLALTKELIQLMKGKVQVESEIDQGSTFTVRLPITQKGELHKQTISPATQGVFIGVNSPILASPNSTGEKPSLLIIEDNPDIVEYLYTCLEDQYDLFSASDGQEGIEAAFEQIPDLIISDVMMPRKNGYEVCETLKLDERTSHIPIVMLTAKADQESKIEGYKRGADAYLAKPFNQEELFIRLQKLLEIRKTLQSRYQNGVIPPPSEDPIIKVEDEFLIKARQYILGKIDDANYRGESLGKDIGMSRASLHRKIKALTGLSTSHFIRSIRIEHAKKLLKNPDLQITSVTYLSGFNHPAYFNRVFHKIVGQSPREWREENLKKTS